jgi:branched-chain amino acid transport system substrate-binding protein
MASYNDTPAEKDDLYRILTQATPQEVEDRDAPGACKLEALNATPSYEQ